MRTLLVANQRVLMGFDRLARLPNLGLCSISANTDKELCDVRIVDLVMAGSKPIPYFQRLLREYQPDVVGLSCMVFQYAAALELAKVTKRLNKNIKVVMGGYYPTVDYEVILESDDMEFIDFVIRGEGEVTFNDLIRALSTGTGFGGIPGLSYRDNGTIVHNSRSDVSNLDYIKPPDRNTRIIAKGFHIFGYPADVIETSRGCTFTCNYCSINMMYGRSYRTYKIDRILDDIRDAQDYGAKAIFIVDDNITLDSVRYRDICDAIIQARLNTIKYAVQVSVRGIKNTPGLAEKMAKSGAKWVFLGIENASDDVLNFLGKGNQHKSSDSFEVVNTLKEHGIIVIGGLILGNPDDTENDIRANLEYAKKIGIDIAHFVILTPYPKTPIRDELIRQGLVTNLNDYSKYTCYHANVKTKYLSAERLFELKNEIDYRFPVESGAVWRLIKEFPLFFVKFVPRRLVKEPKNMVNFLFH